MKYSLVYLMSAIVLLTMNSFGEEQARDAATDASQEAKADQGFASKTSQFFSKTASKTKRLATDATGKIKTTFANTASEIVTDNIEDPNNIITEGVFTILKKGDERILIEVKRDSAGYSELVIPEDVTSLSCNKREVSFADETGAEQKAKCYLFEGLNVEKLVFPENCQISEIDTQCFEGLKHLREIEFRGRVPVIEEAHFIFKVGEARWRSNLEKLIFIKEYAVDHVASICDGVKYLEIAEGIDVKAFKSFNALTAMKSLEQIVIPYALAQDILIPWSDVFQQCKGLKDKEVLSLPSQQNSVVLLQAKSVNGTAEISDVVTHIRSDALLNAKEVILPLTYETFIATDAISVKTLMHRKWVLKKKSLQIMPDILSLQTRHHTRFSSFLKPKLYIQSGYKEICVSLSSAGQPVGDKMISQQTENGLCSTLVLSLGYDTDYDLQFFVKSGLQGKDAFLVTQIQNEGIQESGLHFTTAKRRKWLMKSLFQLALWVFGVPLLMFLLNKKAPRNSKLAAISQAYFSASLLKHGIFFLACLIFILGKIGLLAEWMDRLFWTPILLYVNTTFLSSLHMSSLVTGLRMVIGLLKGTTIGALGTGIRFDHVLDPVAEILSRVGFISWLSTLIVLLVRFIGELIRMFGTLIFSLVGAMSIVWAFPVTQKIKTLRLFRLCFFTIIGIGIGVPVILFICSWFSSQLAMLTGSTFEASLVSFKTMISGISFKSFTTMESMKTSLGMLTDGVTSLLTASVSYTILKLIDCILIPLSFISLFFFIKRKMVQQPKALEVNSTLHIVDKRHSATEVMVPSAKMERTADESSLKI